MRNSFCPFFRTISWDSKDLHGNIRVNNLEKIRWSQVFINNCLSFSDHFHTSEHYFTKHNGKFSIFCWLLRLYPKGGENEKKLSYFCIKPLPCESYKQFWSSLCHRFVFRPCPAPVIVYASLFFLHVGYDCVMLYDLKAVDTIGSKTFLGEE